MQDGGRNSKVKMQQAAKQTKLREKKINKKKKNYRRDNWTDRHEHQKAAIGWAKS